MLVPVVNIKIGNFKFFGCKSFEVNKDVNTLSATGKVELPLRAMLTGENSQQAILVGDEIKIGDKIEIEAGYKGEPINKIFVGFVRNIDPSDVVKIEVEDSLYLLRKKAIIINEKDISLNDFCAKLIEGTGLSLSDNTVKMMVDKVHYKGNCAGALAKVKEQLKLSCYFDEESLYVGGMQMNAKEQINAIYGRNIIKNSLKYEYKDANPVQVEVVGKLDSGEETKVIAGQAGGSKMTFYKYNVSDESLLSQIAEEELQRYSFDGFKGSLGMKFIPFAELGGSVKYTNENYEHAVSGVYHIAGIKYSLNSSGLNQTIKLGAKL